jgi:hypothetical protein
VFYLGLDLGQRHDPTAIALVERVDLTSVRVRHLERVPLGTPYPGVVARVQPDLLAVVHVLLERGELKLARGLQELGPLVRELTDVREATAAGNMTTW